MKINITKKQYEIIVKSLEANSFIYGPMSDFVDDKYKKDTNEIEEVQKYLLQYAKDFDFEKNLCDCGAKDPHLDEDYYEKILDDLALYDEQQLFEGLAHELGKRDFHNKYSKEEADKLIEEHGGYLGVPVYEFDKKYYDEFNENGYERLFIKK